MTTLTKDTGIVFVPGSPGVPDKPGVIATPAYTTYTTTSVQRPGIDLSGLTGVPGTITHVDQATTGSYSQPSYIITTSVPTYHPAIYSVPPKPGKPGTPASLIADYKFGWNSSAVSAASLTTDGSVTFSPSRGAQGVIVGLVGENPGPDYARLRHAIYITNNFARAIEYGAQQGTGVGLVGGEVLSIQRRGSKMTYLVDGVEMYVSELPVTSTNLYAVAEMYAGGDKVENAAFVVEVTGKNGADVALEPLAGFAAQAAHAAVISKLLPLSGEAEGDRPQGAKTALQAVQGFASAKLQDSAVKQLLEPISGLAADSGLVPTYAVSAGSLAYVLSSGFSITGEVGGVDAVLQLIDVLSADAPYGEVGEVLYPLRSLALQFPVLNAVADLTLTDKFTLVAEATAGEPTAFRGTAVFSFKAGMGMAAKLRTPKLRLLATGTNISLGRAYLDAPMMTLNASMRAGGVARAKMSFGAFKLRSFGGMALARKILGPYTLSGHVRSGANGGVLGTIPMQTLKASMSDSALMRARLVLPMLRLAGSGVGRMRMPMARLLASMSDGLPIVYEAYAMNLLTKIDAAPGAPSYNEVTQYTNFPFKQIVRFGDNYFGVADNGLFLLGGDTDNGAPIAWDFETCMTDFQSKQDKRVASAYIGGRVDDSVTMTVFMGEKAQTTYDYPFTTPRGFDAQNYRVKFGRGTKARYYAFGLSDATGKDVNVSSLDIEIDILKRAI